MINNLLSQETQRLCMHAFPMIKVPKFRIFLEMKSTSNEIRAIAIRTNLTRPQILLNFGNLTPIRNAAQRAQQSRSNDQIRLVQRRVYNLREPEELFRSESRQRRVGEGEQVFDGGS